MIYALTWLPEVLEKAGLKVAETPNWRSRGRREMGKVLGVICHHTATPVTAKGNMPTLQMLIDGRPDLPGPLCQLGLGRDGTFYVVAAGYANHAGKGRWGPSDKAGNPKDNGNLNFIGIEAENSGLADDPWPEVQLEAYQRGVAAILSYVNATSDMCCGHKEYAPGRKIDPSFHMPEFRAAVSAFMAGKTPKPLIAASDDKNRPTIRQGMRGEDVAAMQRRLQIDPDGIFGPKTEAALRQKQRDLKLVPDGICGPRSWAALNGEPVPQDPEQAASAPAAPPAPQPRPEAPSQMELGKAGIALIQYYEQCEQLQKDGSYKAYPDPGSKDGLPWTIGWGSTGPDVTDGTIWPKAKCDQRFAEDMKRYGQDVLRAIGKVPTTQNQFDAMVSFHYNTGAIATATLTKRHIAGDHAGARDAFGMWVKNDGKIMRGLVLRRKAEADLYAKAGK